MGNVGYRVYGFCSFGEAGQDAITNARAAIASIRYFGSSGKVGSVRLVGFQRVRLIRGARLVAGTAFERLAIR